MSESENGLVGLIEFIRNSDRPVTSRFTEEAFDRFVQENEIRYRRGSGSIMPRREPQVTALQLTPEQSNYFNALDRLRREVQHDFQWHTEYPSDIQTAFIAPSPEDSSPVYINTDHPDLLDPDRPMWPQQFEEIAPKPSTRGGIRLFIEEFRNRTSPS